MCARKCKLNSVKINSINIIYNYFLKVCISIVAVKLFAGSKLAA